MPMIYYAYVIYAIYYAYESPLKDRSTSTYVSVCVCVGENRL